MEIKDFSQIHFASYNPRILSDHMGAALDASMTTFGDISGITFNLQTQTLVTGHQRLAILRKRFGENRVKVYIEHRFEGADEFGTVATGFVAVEGTNLHLAYREVQWDEGKEKAANIGANKIEAVFDDQLLAQLDYELSQLENGADLLALTGQTENEISKLLDSVGARGEGDTAEDEAPDIDEQNPPASKLGEVYQLGEHRLMCGDATSADDADKLLNGDTVSLIFTDPPYGVDVVTGGKVGADFGIAKKGIYSEVIGDETTDTARDFYTLWSTLCDRQIIWGGNYFTDFLPFSDGWLIWDKRGDSGIRNTFADGEMAWVSFHTPVRIYKQLWNGMIREGEHDKRVHPTQKPTQTLTAIIKDFTDSGDVIVDVFGGSGSTLIACEQTNRTCYMMELDPKYCDVIRKRYAKHIGEEANWEAATPCIMSADHDTEATSHNIETPTQPDVPSPDAALLDSIPVDVAA